ncbi:hypothetical protein [uncultured Helicobacter sp.]|uniref:hypothetical protein n=1 Tax=uncultured Helicobacter sp. TaxID=175537 RepID=UPI00260A7C9D|nr:hypothetical protein [uncultured Helicobacter sp.]
MKVLTRSEVVIIDSNLLESTPTFELGREYHKDDKVHSDKYVYVALSDNVNKPLTDVLSWKKVGTSNQWACFDYYLNTSCIAEDELDISFSCFGAKGIYISNIEAKFLSIEVIDVRNAQVIEERTYKLYGQNISSWSEYFFGNWGKKYRHHIYYERNTFTRNIIFRVRAWGIRDIKIGSIICGDLIELGISLYADNSISMLDFSKVLTDEEGNTSLTKGNFKRTNAFNVLVSDDEMDKVSYELAELRGQAVVFIIANNYECLMSVGFLKNHEILLSKVGASIVSIEIEGLI